MGSDQVTGRMQLTHMMLVQETRSADSTGGNQAVATPAVVVEARRQQ
jgi:hypothetical protein